MKITRIGFLAAAVFSAGLLATGHPALAQQTPPPLTPAQIAQILASPDRSAADWTNDQQRKAATLLEFIGIRPGIVAFDISAAGGYTTELLARASGPTGKVYGQGQPRDPNRAPPAVPEGNSNPKTAAVMGAAPAPSAVPAPSASRAFPVALTERSEKLRSSGASAAPITPVLRSFNDPIPPELTPEKIDLVTLMFNYHDLGHFGVDRTAMNQAVFHALKHGGVYVIADHAGRPGTGISESGTLHRIEEAFLRKEVEAAGFKLAAEGDFLRNPNDPKDRNTPTPPQPKDEFVLKFVKP